MLSESPMYEFTTTCLLDSLQSSTIKTPFSPECTKLKNVDFQFLTRKIFLKVKMQEIE